MSHIDVIELFKKSSELQIWCSRIDVEESYIHFNHSNSMQSLHWICNAQWPSVPVHTWASNMVISENHNVYNVKR